MKFVKSFDLESLYTDAFHHKLK